MLWLSRIPETVDIGVLNMNFVKVLFFGFFSLSAVSHAQVVQPQDVTISMGLVPVYELTRVGGCPYLLAAPSPLYYHLSYRKCSTDAFTPIVDFEDRFNINDFMRSVCQETLQSGSGCQVELQVNFPDMTPVFVNQDSDE